MVLRPVLRPALRPVVRSLMERGSGAFNPVQLFAANEPGAHFEVISPAQNASLQTMFQDSAGTQLVTAVGQPVGLLLDTKQGGARGPELIASGDFSSAAPWTLTGTAAIASGQVSLPASSAVSQSVVTAVGRTYEVLFDVVTASNKIVGQVGTTPAGQETYSSAAYITTSGSKRFQFTATATISYVRILNDVTPTTTAVIDNISVRELPGNHASQATATSRPTLQQDANGNYYLSFDGVDDGLATGSIDFTSTDKMTVWAGVNKASDAATGMVLELSATADTNAGAFYFAASLAAAANYELSLGTSAARTLARTGVYPAGASHVHALPLDRAGASTAAQVVWRINGTTAVRTDSGTLASGNFGSYPLYIGRRGGSTLPFNGRLYSITVRGAQTDTALIQRMERYVANRMGVALA